MVLAEYLVSQLVGAACRRVSRDRARANDLISRELAGEARETLTAGALEANAAIALAIGYGRFHALALVRPSWAADWVRVKPANFPRWEPPDPVVAVFQILRRNQRSRGGDYLESIVYEALVNCHRQLNTLRGIYRGEKRHAKQATDAARSIGDPEPDPQPELDLSDLTESEKEHIRRRP